MIGVVQARAILAAMLAGSRSTSAPTCATPPSCRDTPMRSTCSGPARGRGSYGPGPRRVRPFRGRRHAGRHLEAIAGVFRSDAGEPEPDAVRARTARGFWRVRCRPTRWPNSSASPACAARVPHRRGPHHRRIATSPATGERVEALGWRFEVVDLDGRRIDKVLATPLATAEV